MARGRVAARPMSRRLSVLTLVRCEARVHDPGLDFYPSARDRRGPLRLFCLDPDT